MWIVLNRNLSVLNIFICLYFCYSLVFRHQNALYLQDLQRLNTIRLFVFLSLVLFFALVLCEEDALSFDHRQTLRAFVCAGHILPIDSFENRLQRNHLIPKNKNKIKLTNDITFCFEWILNKYFYCTLCVHEKLHTPAN